MFGRILVIGFLVLFSGAFLIVMFPNASWNHGLSLAVWFLSIVMVLSTFGFCVRMGIRLLTRVMSRAESSGVSKTSHLGGHAEKRGSHWIKVGLATAALVALFVVFLLIFIEHEIRSSTVYHSSLNEACASDAVAKAIGRPIQAGWFNLGEVVQSSDGRGRAKLTIPISGPKGKGKLKIDAVRSSGNWRFLILQFTDDRGGDTADLLRERRP